MTARQTRPPLTSPRRVAEGAEPSSDAVVERSLQPWGNAAAGRGRLAAEPGPREAALLETARPIPNQDAIYEHFARHGPDGRVDPADLAAWGYRRGPVLDRPRSGLRAVVFLPLPGAAAPSTPRGHQLLEVHGAPLRPVLVFGGRAAGDREVEESDALGIGSYQFASCMADIVAALRGARSRVDVVGHGLGGVLAQLAAAHHPQAIGRVVTFQSAPVDVQDAEQVEHWNRTVPGHQAVHSAHHRSGAAPPEQRGEQRTPGDAWTWGFDPDKEGKHAPPLSCLVALRGEGVPGLAASPHDVDALRSLDRSVLGERPADLGARPLGEALRAGLERVVEAPMGTEQHAGLRSRALELAASPSVSFRQVLALIDSTPGVGAKEKALLQEEVRKAIIERMGSAPPV